MPRNITVTWEDLQWPSEYDQEPDRTGGFVIDGSHQVQRDDMSTNDLIVMHNFAKQDLDAMIECEFCVEYLKQDNEGVWVSVLSNSNMGINRYDEHHHIHKPDKLWYEILVDILDDYGAHEDNNGSWYSEHSTINYKYAIERQYAVHLEWNPTEDEWNLISNEINLRAANRRAIIQKLS
jgi:hypothetical protein